VIESATISRSLSGLIFVLSGLEDRQTLLTVRTLLNCCLPNPIRQQAIFVSPNTFPVEFAATGARHFHLGNIIWSAALRGPRDDLRQSWADTMKSTAQILNALLLPPPALDLLAPDVSLRMTITDSLHSIKVLLTNLQLTLCHLEDTNCFSPIVKPKRGSSSPQDQPVREKSFQDSPNQNTLCFL
jgi:hypothetical protein